MQDLKSNVEVAPYVIVLRDYCASDSEQILRQSHRYELIRWAFNSPPNSPPNALGSLHRIAKKISPYGTFQNPWTRNN